MGVKRRMFGSHQERKNYYKLCIRWSSAYNIYHNLPFLNVFSIIDVSLSEIEKSMVKKTSIDFTL